MLAEHGWASDPRSPGPMTTRLRRVGKPRATFHGSIRVARGAVVGAACLLSTVALHSAAGGSVGGLGLVLSLVVSLSLGIAMADRRRSLLTLAALLLGGQMLLHLLISIGTGHGAMLHGSPSPTAMALAHLIACLVTAAILTRADDIAHCWLAFIRSMRRGVPALADPPSWWAPGVLSDAARASLPALVETAAPRGPPSC